MSALVAPVPGAPHPDRLRRGEQRETAGGCPATSPSPAIRSPAWSPPTSPRNSRPTRPSILGGREGRREPAHRRVPDYLWDETEVVLDCLLGTGAAGELEAGGRMGRSNQRGRSRGVPVIAVDVPSGVDAFAGTIAQGCVAADITVTFHAAKPASSAARLGGGGK